MKIGIPKEIKTHEGRVVLTPSAVSELTLNGHAVLFQSSAGELSGYQDSEYIAAGAEIVDSAKAVFEGAELIVKVKEPQTAELELLNSQHILFSYLHLAAAPELTQALCDIGLTAVAFETVTHNNQLPLLAPMSDIAGRIAVQSGSNLLHQPQGGRGILLGGITGTERGKVVILGGGTAGTAATRMASAMGANVMVFDPDRNKQEKLEEIGQNVTTRQPFKQDIQEAVRQADLLIGAVLIPGERAPHLVTADDVRKMKNGSVIIDISVDQGGCIETTRPTTYADPTYRLEGVIHFGVTNMPGAVPRTATQALTAAVLPYVLKLAEPGWQENRALASGINVQGGRIVLPALMSSD